MVRSTVWRKQLTSCRLLSCWHVGADTNESVGKAYDTNGYALSCALAEMRTLWCRPAPGGSWQVNDKFEDFRMELHGWPSTLTVKGSKKFFPFSVMVTPPSLTTT